jgi:hypothetical protein
VPGGTHAGPNVQYSRRRRPHEAPFSSRLPLLRAAVPPGALRSKHGRESSSVPPRHGDQSVSVGQKSLHDEGAHHPVHVPATGPPALPRRTLPAPVNDGRSPDSTLCIINVCFAVQKHCRRRRCTAGPAGAVVERAVRQRASPTRRHRGAYGAPVRRPHRSGA